MERFRDRRCGNGLIFCQRKASIEFSFGGAEIAIGEMTFDDRLPKAIKLAYRELGQIK